MQSYSRMTVYLKHIAPLRFLALWPLLAVACGTSGPASNDDPSRLQPTYGSDGKLQTIAYDRDNDGKADAWGYMDGARVTRVEVDENSDGRVDRWEYYEAAAEPDGQTPDQRALVRIERAMKRDGTVSRREFFTNGRLTRVEEDTDGNGQLDKWETYTNGALSMLLLDTGGHGRADRRFVYGADGALVRVEEDSAGSGVFTPLNP